MTRSRILFVAIAALAAAGASAQKTEADVRAFYVKVNAAFSKGLTTRDGRAAVALLDRVLAPDFISTLNVRPQNRTEYLRDLRSAFTAENPPRLSMRVLEMGRSPKRGKAMLVLITEVVVSGGGKDGERPYSFHLPSRDTWVRTARGYRWVRNEAIKPPKPPSSPKPAGAPKPISPV